MRYQIENGTVSLGGKTILNHIDFSIKGQEKIAVVGRNGAGKTTLLRLISGELSLDRDDKRFGKGITTDKAISIGFLHQQSFSNAERTVEEEILSLVSEENIFSKERYYFEKEYDWIFTGFGFKKEDKCKKIGQFSGGEQTKLAFIKLLLSKPDILLLDEPTNHLDIASVEWMEEYLVSYEKAIIMVSHDRFFIDRTAEIIYELSDGKLMRYVGNYTEYKKQKEKQRVSQQKKYDAQQKEIARLNENKWVGGKPAFGYKVNKQGQFEIDEEEAKIVKDIFKLRSKGISLAKIGAKYGFSKQKVDYILKNKNYIGVFEYRGTS